MTIFTDAATIPSLAAATANEVASYIDAASSSSVTTLISSEGGPYSDSASFSIITTIPVGEFEFLHPTGSWGVFDTDDGMI
jgi:hypothetical protein